MPFSDTALNDQDDLEHYKVKRNPYMCDSISLYFGLRARVFELQDIFETGIHMTPQIDIKH